jgi:hypothetical protein
MCAPIPTVLEHSGSIPVPKVLAGDIFEDHHDVAMAVRTLFEFLQSQARLAAELAPPRAEHANTKVYLLPSMEALVESVESRRSYHPTMVLHSSLASSHRQRRRVLGNAGTSCGGREEGNRLGSSLSSIRKVI